MKELIKSLMKKTGLYAPWKNWRDRVWQEREVKEWMANGRPVPPPHLFKQRVLRDYSEKYHLQLLVETGTFYGDMIEAQKRHFKKVYSIELSTELHALAQKRFASDRNVVLIQGDSGEKIEGLLKELDRPTLFWLDGHYSCGVTAKGAELTPISKELAHIFAAPDLGHVILVDDARSFSGEDDYPTIEKLTEYVLAEKPLADVSVHDDIIRIVPKK